MAFRDHPLVILGARLLTRVGARALSRAKDSILDDGEELVELAATEAKTRIKKHKGRAAPPRRDVEP